MLGNLELVILLGFPIVFISMWIIMAFIMRKMSGFSYQTSKIYNVGMSKDHIHNCSASLRGIHFGNCLSFYRFDDGILIKISKLFLGGGLYIKDGSILSKEYKINRFLFFSTPVLKLRTKDYEIILSGKSANFVNKFLL